MDLAELETHAAALAACTSQLQNVETELTAAITELRDLPRRAGREERYARLTGGAAPSAARLEELQKRQAFLARERERLEGEMDELRTRLIEGFASEGLTVPLAGRPERVNGFWVFPFRDGVRFPHAMAFIGATLGLGNPVALEGVLVEHHGVRVPVEFGMDETTAMEKVVAAFDQIRHTLQLKVPRADAW